jgi:hypothetical protein
MDEDADETDNPAILTPAPETALTEAKAKAKAKVRKTKEKEKTTLPRPTPMAHANPNSNPALTAVVPTITPAIASNAWRKKKATQQRFTNKPTKMS